MLINFSKLTFSKNSIRFNIRVSNSLGTAQARPFVRPGLVPICLQKLSIDDTSRQIWVLLHSHLRNLARAFSTCMLRLTAFAVVFNIAYASNHAPWRNARARARPVQKKNQSWTSSLARALLKAPCNSHSFRTRRHAIDVGFYCICEQQKLRRLCAFAQMRSLARAFAIRIQNISTFRRRWRATNVGLYCMCEQQKLKRVCGLATF